MAQLLIKGTKVAEVVGDTTSLIANTLYHPSGTQIITDDGGTIGLTNVNLQNINFDNVANDSISGDKIHGGTISGSELDSSVSFPSFVGMIASFAMSSAPTGWIVCNGAEYAIADYGDLYTAIGTTWGALTNGSSGAGSTHFRVPDLRGAFLRGYDTQTYNSVTYTGQSIGSFENDQFKEHTHSIVYRNDSGGTEYEPYTNINGSNYGTCGNEYYLNSTFGQGDRQGGNCNYRNRITVKNSGGGETRPFNAGINYCIKY